MRSFAAVFVLTLRGLVRSHAFLALAALALAWTAAVPLLLSGDGTDEGARIVEIRYALGGAVAIVAVSLLAASAGSLAAERSERRLQLTLVRPAPRLLAALARMVALDAVAAAVLALAFGAEAFRRDPSRPCRHSLRPILPPVSAEAEEMYAAYLASPDTPEEVKKAPRATVLGILERRAADHYQTVSTNASATWSFPVAAADASRPRALRLRLTNMYDLRDEVSAVIRTDGAVGVVSNVTRSSALVPFTSGGAAMPAGEVSLENRGRRELMLRPRQDVELLVEADGFGCNLLRAYLESLALVSLLVAFGTFLGAALSRPVAVFVAVVTLALSEASPAVLEQCPDGLDASFSDALGRGVAQLSAAVTRPIGSLAPIEKLSEDVCIEPREVARTAATHALLLPLAFALLAALAMAAKTEGR